VHNEIKPEYFNIRSLSFLSITSFLPITTVNPKNQTFIFFIRRRSRYVYTQIIKKTENNQEKINTKLLPKTKTAHKPPHLTANQNIPTLHFIRKLRPNKQPPLQNITSVRNTITSNTPKSP